MPHILRAVYHTVYDLFRYSVETPSNIVVIILIDFMRTNDSHGWTKSVPWHEIIRNGFSQFWFLKMVAICHYLVFLCERKLEILSEKERSMTFKECLSECNEIGSELFNANDVLNMPRDNFIIILLIIYIIKLWGFGITYKL